LATLDRVETLSDSGDDNGPDSATALSRKWYCYLGLRLRLQQGELPGYGDAAAGFFGEA
jgi:hypothetical protein